MHIELQLKKVLQHHGLDRHGVIHDIARDLGVHRHSIAKLYNNQATNPSLDLLGRVCGWVINRSRQAQEHGLPQSLFGIQPLALWQAVTAGQGVSIYLGERQQKEKALPLQRWIARRDSAVASDIVKYLSTHGTVKEPMPQVETEYVPFRILPESEHDRRRHLEEDADCAKRTFDQMRVQEPQSSAILIGSQRSNLLTEHLVADLFGCQPFQAISNTEKVPFYLQYRDAPSVPSCFGQPADLPKGRRDTHPGIYYLDAEHRWTACPWTENKQDCGVVILVRDPGNQAMELALFGFSGRATAVIGKRLLQSDDGFWPPTATSRGKQVGVYICRFSWLKDAKVDEDLGDAVVSAFEVIPIPRSILEEYLH